MCSCTETRGLAALTGSPAPSIGAGSLVERIGDGARTVSFAEWVQIGLAVAGLALSYHIYRTLKVHA